MAQDKRNPFGTPSDEVVTEDNTFSIDLTDQTDPNVIEEGDYIGKLIGVDKTTSKSGNPMWVWDFVIMEGPHAGKEYRLFTAIIPSALWKLNETLQALGVGGFGKTVSFKPQDVLNTKVVMTISDNEYNGQTRSQLDKISAPEEGAGTKFKASDVPF